MSDSKVTRLSVAAEPKAYIVGGRIQEMLAEIATMFVPGTRLTIVCRNTEVTDGSRDMVLTDDTWPEIVRAIKQRQEAEANAE